MMGPRKAIFTLDAHHIECMKCSECWNRPCIREGISSNGHQKRGLATCLQGPVKCGETEQKQRLCFLLVRNSLTGQTRRKLWIKGAPNGPIAHFL